MMFAGYISRRFLCSNKRIIPSVCQIKGNIPRRTFYTKTPDSLIPKLVNEDVTNGLHIILKSDQVNSIMIYSGYLLSEQPHFGGSIEFKQNSGETITINYTESTMKNLLDKMHTDLKS